MAWQWALTSLTNKFLDFHAGFWLGVSFGSFVWQSEPWKRRGKRYCSEPLKQADDKGHEYTMRQSVAENENRLKNLLYDTSSEAFNAFVAERWTSYATLYSAYLSLRGTKKSAKGQVVPARQGLAVNSSKMVDYVIRSALKEDERQGRELWIEIFSRRYASVISAYTNCSFCAANFRPSIR